MEDRGIDVISFLKFGWAQRDDLFQRAGQQITNYAYDSLNEAIDQVDNSYRFGTVMSLDLEDENTVLGSRREVLRIEEDLLEHQAEALSLEFKEVIENTRSTVEFGRPDEISSVLSELLSVAQEMDVFETGDGLYETIEELAQLLNEANWTVVYEASAEADGVASELLEDVTEELIRRIAEDPGTLQEMTDRQFEEVVAEIFSAFGYEVELTKQTRDGGMDVIAVSRREGIPLKLVIECKRYAADNKVGIGVVQRLLGVKVAERANKAILVTTSSFTQPAATFAADNCWELDLKDHKDILEWAHSYMTQATASAVPPTEGA